MTAQKRTSQSGNGSTAMRVRVVYPGSFDPVTNGHLDIIKRAARYFPELIVAVVGNPNKTAMFGIAERVAMLHAACADLPNVEVDSFTGLLVEYIRKRRADLIVKGLRIVSDFEHEYSMALLNRKLKDGVETIFMPASLDYAYVSSSSVKEVFGLGGDISEFVPPTVLRAMHRLGTAKRHA